jgi:hypothetical protein
MRAARFENDAPFVRTADASDIEPQHPARYGQNDRKIVLNRKNALFAGHDQGAENWAAIASLVETCKLYGIDPQAYFADVLTRLVNLWPASRLDELMPGPGQNSVPPIASRRDHTSNARSCSIQRKIKPSEPWGRRTAYVPSGHDHDSFRPRFPALVPGSQPRLTGA